MCSGQVFWLLFENHMTKIELERFEQKHTKTISSGDPFVTSSYQALKARKLGKNRYLPKFCELEEMFWGYVF